MTTPENIQKINDKLRKERENRIPKIIKWLEELKPFTEEFIPNFIRCGAIPKDKLIIGKTYIGNCRNASEAVWNGEVFTYKRTKFGCTYDEDINHFQDDDGYDVFVPIKIKEL